MNFRELQGKFNTFKKRMDPETIEREKRIERKKGIIKGFAVGSIIAGVAALLLSPDKGENNRKRAKEELEKVKETLETNLVKGKKTLIRVYEDTKEIIDEKKDVLTGRSKSEDEMNILDEDFEETEGDSEETEVNLKGIESEETDDEY